jgi:hypothetical protein
MGMLQFLPRGKEPDGRSLRLWSGLRDSEITQAAPDSCCRIVHAENRYPLFRTMI